MYQYFAWECTTWMLATYAESLDDGIMSLEPELQKFIGHLIQAIFKSNKCS